MSKLCIDIFINISSYLHSLIDIISLHNTNRISKKCRFNIILNTRKIIPNFIYEQFNIIQIYSSFNDYSNINKLFTDKLIYLSVSHKYKDDISILNEIPKLKSLTTFKMPSSHFTNIMFKNLTQLIHLDLGQYCSNNFDGRYLTEFKKITYLNLGKNKIDSKYINNLTTLEHLFINTEIKDYDFSLLINLKTLDVSKSKYTLTDSNIYSLINLKNLKCKYSTITTLNHLVNLEVLYIGLNFILKRITNLPYLKILSIIYSNVDYINIPNLLELTLNNLITDEILQNHINLTYLYLGSNTILTNNGIYPLINLKYIHCSINKNITGEGLINAVKLSGVHSSINYINFNKLTNIQFIEYHNNMWVI